MKTPCLLRSSKDLLRANRKEVLSSLLSCQKSGPVTSSFKPSSPQVSICYVNLRKPTPAHSVGKCEFSHHLLQTLGVFNPNLSFLSPLLSNVFLHCIGFYLSPLLGLSTELIFFFFHTQEQRSPPCTSLLRYLLRATALPLTDFILKLCSQ